jgi:microfibrillar-associated protein 1
VKPRVKGTVDEEESEEVGCYVLTLCLTQEDIQSSEYETDSEEEKPQVQFRPVFIPKYVGKLVILLTCNDVLFRRARVTVAEKEALAQDSEEALKKKELEAEERRKQSHDLVAESIRRELAESVCFLHV